MQALINFLARFINATKDAFNVQLSGSIPEGTAEIGKVQLSGSNVAEMQDQNDATADVLTFSENISSIEIYHSEATPQSFAVNGLTLIVAAGGWRSPIAGTPGVTVGIPTGVNCIVARLV